MVSKLRAFAVAAGALIALGLPGLASAATCSAYNLQGVNASYDALYPGSPGDLSTSNVTFRGGNADGCSGVYDGNDNDVQVAALISGMGWGSGYSMTEVKSDGGGASTATVFGIDWSVSYNAGSWTLAYQADPNLAITLDFVLVLKQSQGWAAWWFDGENFQTDGSGQGTYTVEWCSGQPGASSFGCSGIGLSHMTLYFGDAVDYCPNGDCNETPVPGSLALLGLGLAGLAYRLRRKA